MKVLVVGSGGREHALAWKIKQSKQVEKIFCAPGNPGMAHLGENIPILPLEFEKLIDFVKKEQIGLTVVGPEDPLAEGIVDAFNSHNLKIFGPEKKSARLEGSKSFAKDLMRKYHIPTAAYEKFDSAEAARAYIHSKAHFPVVLKASGLAAGKGVLICQNAAEALAGINLIMDERAFGAAGDSMIVEEFLSGEEVSIFALCDGEDYLLLSPAQDHKKAYDGDLGKNTGGMGAYAPAPVATPELIRDVRQRVIEPTLDAMRKEGAPYKGLLYVGLILTADGPKVLEYNCRFGDPETEVVLPLLKSDIVPLLLGTIEGGLKDMPIALQSGYAVDVVMAAGGYPDAYNKGDEITGLEKVDTDILVFHAGTRQEEGVLKTNGGRVLNIVAQGDNFITVREKLYDNINRISFEKAHYRKDIGFRALDRLGK